VAASTPNLVTNAGAGSPNRLLYTGFLHESAPAVTVRTPNGGEKLFTATQFLIEWTAEDPDGLPSQDVYASVDNGATYTAISGCSGLAGHVRACNWNMPGPATTTARIKVVAHDTRGEAGAGFSASSFQWANAPAGVAVAGTNPSTFKVHPAFITVTGPAAGATWTVGSSGKVLWTSNLGSLEKVQLSLSQDNGQTFPIQLLASDDE